MKRIVLCMLFVAAAFSYAHAQEEAERINEIKKNLDFIYATGTSTTSAQDASDNARELLALEIDQWLKTNIQGDYSGYVAKAGQQVAEIQTRKGNLHRAFVYVCKADILTLGKDQSVLLVNVEESPTPTRVDTLTVNQTSARTFHQDVQTAQPIAATTVQSAYSPTATEQELLAVRSLSEINSFLATNADNGRVKGYGKYDENTRLYDKAYLWLFDRTGSVLAVMSKTGSNMVNVRTGQPDAIANYGRCGVIWFQINE